MITKKILDDSSDEEEEQKQKVLKKSEIKSIYYDENDEMYLSDDLAEMTGDENHLSKMYRVEVVPKERKQFARVINTNAGRKKESIERVIRKTESMRRKKNKIGRSTTNRENKSSE